MRTNKLKTKKYRRNRTFKGGETSLERAQHKAATKIQGLTRGKFTRKYLPQIKEYRLQKKEDAKTLRRRWANSPRLEAAKEVEVVEQLSNSSPRRKSTSAKKIQGLFRGQLTRRYLPQIKADRLAHRLHKKSEDKRLRKLWTNSPASSPREIEPSQPLNQINEDQEELDLDDFDSFSGLSDNVSSSKSSKSSKKYEDGRYDGSYPDSW